MKTTFTKTTITVLSLLLILIAFTSCTTVENISATNDKKDKAASVKSNAIRSSKAVKIYPDMVKRVMHVKSTEDRPLDFFVFDASGEIVAYHKLNEKEHIRVSDLKIGSYTYQVFEGDTMTDSGKLIFK